MTTKDKGWLGNEAMNLFVCLLNNFLYHSRQVGKKLPKVYALSTHSTHVLLPEKEWYVEAEEALEFYKDHREVASWCHWWYTQQYMGFIAKLLDLFPDD